MSVGINLPVKRSGIKLLLGAMLMLSAISGFAAEPVLRFSAIPDQDETRLQERFTLVADYLSRRLGVPVEYLPVKDYAATVIAFRNNQVQLAWFGGLSGVQARRLVPGSKAIVQGVEDPDFGSYFIAHASTGLEPGKGFPQGIAGKSFTFGSKGSTSGRLMPEYFIRRHLGAPDEVFARVGFSGDHTQTNALVQSGAYQVGAVNYQVWEEEVAAGQIDIDKVKVIWKTPPYPDYHWTIRGDVDATWGEGFADRVRAALIGMKDPQLLEAFPRSGFIAAENADFTEILDIAKEIGLID
ncbi:MAG: putative selenate ABC transporter substrate-binding protein [Gammaproteobacteria bacterium]|nr:putative selenate ABC transporter substrate-binding protein [Gammaproteobacteria bacterium]